MRSSRSGRPGLSPLRLSAPPPGVDSRTLALLSRRGMPVSAPAALLPLVASGYIGLIVKGQLCARYVPQWPSSPRPAQSPAPTASPGGGEGYPVAGGASFTGHPGGGPVHLPQVRTAQPGPELLREERAPVSCRVSLARGLQELIQAHPFHAHPSPQGHEACASQARGLLHCSTASVSHDLDSTPF